MVACVVQGMLTETAMGVQVFRHDLHHDPEQSNPSRANVRKAGPTCAADQYSINSLVPLDCNAASGSMTFQANWEAGVLQEIVSLPVGTMDFGISFNATGDLDMAIYDGTTCVIGYGCHHAGACSHPEDHCHDYQGMDMYFSGDDFIGPVFVEAVKISGATTIPLEVRVNPYAFVHNVTMSYNSSGILNCSDSSEIASCVACSNYPFCAGGLVPYCDGSTTVVCGAATTAAPTPPPTPAPPSTPSPAPTGGSVQATGDPHLMNLLGQRFDLHKEGLHTLVRVPRAERGAALLVVEAEARQMGVACADMYFQSVNLTGRWVGSQGRVFSAGHVAKTDSQRWLRYGKVELKVVEGHTKSGIVYLNLFVRHLKFAGYPVGGILGMDDHAAAATPSQKCQMRVSLGAIDGPVLSPENASTAAADLE